MYKNYEDKVNEIIDKHKSDNEGVLFSLKAILPEVQKGLKRIDKKLDYYEGRREVGCREGTMDKYFYHKEISENLHGIVKRIEKQ